MGSKCLAIPYIVQKLVIVTLNVESVNVRVGFDTGYTQSQRSRCGLDELGGDIVADWSLEHVACVTS